MNNDHIRESIEQKVAAFTRPLKTKELADLIGLQPGTLRNWRRAGRGPDFEQFGMRGGVHYSVENVLSWIAQQRLLQEQQRAQSHLENTSSQGCDSACG